MSGLTTPQWALLDNVASGVENCIAERPMFQSALSRNASLRHSLNCGIERSGITFKFFYWFSLKNRGVWRSAISVTADWLIFLSRKYRNAPCKKKHLLFEYLDVAFRYSLYSGVTHQNVKINDKCTDPISQIFPFEYWWIFQCPRVRIYHKTRMIITRPTPV